LYSSVYTFDLFLYNLIDEIDNFLHITSVKPLVIRTLANTCSIYCSETLIEKTLFISITQL
ncbi:hypothetical protein P5F78_01840, partial [Shouchella clausii]|uniref:hypothetical protein n=1 Tax=Shouchella clausii TaxID=79880 RepID=UPI002E200D52|nr:hypothetical protein [Shouchella clausii]